MSSVYAILVDPSVAGRLAIKEIEVPKAGLAQAIVQVEAISLNRGEVKNAMIAEAFVREAGADEVVIGEDISVASTYGPYHLILTSCDLSHLIVKIL